MYFLTLPTKKRIQGMSTAIAAQRVRVKKPSYPCISCCSEPLTIMFARSSFRIALDAWRIVSRQSITTSSRIYPYSRVAIIPSAPPGSPPASLRRGKGLMAYLQQTLPSTEKQKIISTIFSRTHPDRVRPGTVLTVNLTHAPTSFSGVLISVRRRGPDTSFVLRNVVQRTGVEMQFFVNSPHVKEILVVSRAGGLDRKKRKGLKKAKLFYLRDSPEKMTAMSAGVR
ncbi:translation protein SH3-like domain-containing protein [Multifurca ochricompacta]|uniref:Translation protein SH3-like domain-containing protein n=1 Tax=Multifurca ochricompacta TaxID=376703 RepID=A0AAD4QP38_9AGAM|nr:translation protein SH3-like domain-containing protein [Multifurca ochricompacta]